MPADKDTAAISVNLSTQLINVAIAILALSGAFYTFILDKKDASVPFYVFYVLVFIFLLLSMFFGALGIDNIKRNGENNIWVTNLAGKINWLNRQAVMLVLGLLCIGILPFLGKEKKPDKENVKPLLEQMQRRDSLIMKSMELIIEQQKIISSQQKHEAAITTVSSLPKTTPTKKQGKK